MPFKFAAGSQTSILISESLDGFKVAATRQNAGRFISDAFCCVAVDPGGVKVPAGTVCANVTVVFGNESPVRLSHVAASADVAPEMTAAHRTASLMVLTFILS